MKGSCPSGTVMVHVRERHIAAGTPGCPRTCAVALAVAERLGIVSGVHDVEVDDLDIMVTELKTVERPQGSGLWSDRSVPIHLWKTPGRVRAFIRAYDEDEPRREAHPRAFRFALDLGQGERGAGKAIQSGEPKWT